MDRIARQIPSSIIGGETIWIASANTAEAKNDITVSGHTPASGATLAYQFASPSSPATIAAVANITNTGWTLTIPSSTTLAWYGRIFYAGFLTVCGCVHVVDEGEMYVRASPLRASSWSAVIAAVDAAMLTVATSPNGSITVDGVSMSYRGTADLVSIRAFAERKLVEETGSRTPRRILSRFLR